MRLVREGARYRRSLLLMRTDVIRLLVVSADGAVPECLRQDVNGAGIRVSNVLTRESANAIEFVRPELAKSDVVVLDTRGRRGQAALLTEVLLSLDSCCPVIVLATEEDKDACLDAMRAGASDCLPYDRITREALARSARNAWEKARFRRELYVRDMLLDSIDEGVFTVDRDRRVTTMNRAAERLTGHVRSHVVGEHCYDVFKHELCGELCLLEEALDSGRTERERIVHTDAGNGDTLALGVRMRSMRDTRGEIVGGFATIRDISEIERIREAAREKNNFESMIATSAAMHDVFALLPSLARTESAVLIEGASGTGKELVARAIHNLSPRRDAPFVAINCAALPETLLESELFGYKAGAFTGATKDKPGRIAAAENGTLFLDEIGDIAPEVQARLLRFLQEKTYQPLGSVTQVHSEARVVAATNRNLPAAIADGSFRADLYYRLRVLCMSLPTLAERPEDIPVLAQAFLQEVCLLQRKSIAGFRQPVMSRLLEHDYPGNVRELRNIVEHAVALCHDEMIDMHDLPGYLQPLHPAPVDDGDLVKSSLKRVERAHLEELLRRHRGNRTAVARELGIHTSTLYRKIHALGVELPDVDGRRRY